MSKVDYEKAARRERLTFTPSWRSIPATQRQLDYIVDLAFQKGEPKPKLPKTKRGASDMIERLLELPDQATPQPVRLVIPTPPKDEARLELIVELTERFPSLSPQTIRSLIQLFVEVDYFGSYFFWDALENGPEDPDALVLHILAAFVAWVKDNDEMATG